LIGFPARAVVTSFHPRNSLLVCDLKWVTDVIRQRVARSTVTSRRCDAPHNKRLAGSRGTCHGIDIPDWFEMP
jgi:hypothetical protein